MRRLLSLAPVVMVLALVCTNIALADPRLPLRRLPISGDQDGSETPLTFNSPDFSLLRDVQTFRVPGEGPQTVALDFIYREALYSNEFGFYRADNASAQVGGLMPGEAGYIRAAMERAIVVFPAGSQASTPDYNATFTGGDVLVFFLVVNGTVASLQANNPDNLSSHRPIAFFSLDQLNPDTVDHFVGFRNTNAGLTQFGFEDLYAGGDLDYDDIVYNVAVTLQPSPNIEKRDVVFIRGFDSAGRCDGANEWVRSYLEANKNGPHLRNIQLGRFLNFSYATGDHYDCPREAPAYTGIDTCDGVAVAAAQLQRLITNQTTGKVAIVAHSMGGMVAAYMIAANPTWARAKVASVITFESPLRGVNDWATWLNQYRTPCSPLGGAPTQSARDLMENSDVVKALSSAAGIVTFYHFEAAGSLDDLFFPRSNVRLDGGRPFFLWTWCGVNSFKPDCTPPESVIDDHVSLWQNRMSRALTDPPTLARDKAPLVACGIAGAWDCTTIGPASSPNALEVAAGASAQVNVAPLSGRIQFAATFGAPVRMKITAPNGTVYGPDGTGPVAGYAVAADSEIYQITDPVNGLWTVDLLGPADAVTTAELGFSVLEIALPQNPLAPIAVAGGPYVARRGAQLVLDATASYDADGQIVRFEWDVDNDGRFDLSSTSSKINFAYSQVYFGGVTLRVTDSQGRTATATSTVRAGPMLHLPLIRR